MHELGGGIRFQRHIFDVAFGMQRQKSNNLSVPGFKSLQIQFDPQSFSESQLSQIGWIADVAFAVREHRYRQLDFFPFARRMRRKTRETQLQTGIRTPPCRTFRKVGRDKPFESRGGLSLSTAGFAFSGEGQLTGYNRHRVLAPISGMAAATANGLASVIRERNPGSNRGLAF